MQIKDLELYACRNKPLPEFLTLPETCLYISLRYLYQSYHKGEISKENAKSEKRKMLGEYERFKMTYDNWLKEFGYHQGNIRRAGTLLSDIEKTKNVKDIAVLACKVIGIMIGDESFFPRQMKKLGGLNEQN